MKFYIILLVVAYTFTSYLSVSGQLAPTVILKGIVVNKVSKEPISINIEVFDENGKWITKAKSNSKYGSYLIAGLKSNSKYSFNISDLNYLKYSFKMDIPQTKYEEFSKDVQLVPIQKGQEFPLSVIPFEKNSYELRQGHEFFLKEMTELLNENPSISVSIISFPDNNNDKNFNLELTQKRAEALLNYFVNNGVRKNRLNAVSNSETDPKNPPPTKKRAKGKKYIGSVLIRIN